MPAGRLRIVFALALALPAVGFAQAPAALVPAPVPTGAPLTPLPGQEAARGIVPASVSDAPATPFLDGQPAQPAASTGPFSTNCTFDWCGTNHWCGRAGAYTAGSSSCQVLLGAYFTTDLGPPIPTFNYVPLTVRHGWMLDSPGDDTGWRGNWEFLTDITVSAITSDYGHWFAGPSLYLRYNFLQRESPVVPYSQVGAGFILNDAYRDKSQKAVGAYFEFYLHAEVGVKYFLSKNWSLDLEGGLQHISNANTAGRNYGVNAVGAQIGFTYYFPTGGRE